MKSSHQVNTRATKLSDVLNGMGFDLKHADSVRIISKLESDTDWQTNACSIGKDQQIAERLLDEMLEAKSELNYTKFTQRMDVTVKREFSEKLFLRSMRDMREDFGVYVNRKYLGAVNGVHYSEAADKYPGNIRHIWRGVFENQQLFITLGIYTNDGIPTINGIRFR